jgi:hypothetical protein
VQYALDFSQALAKIKSDVFISRNRVVVSHHILTAMALQLRFGQGPSEKIPPL